MQATARSRASDGIPDRRIVRPAAALPRGVCLPADHRARSGSRRARRHSSASVRAGRDGLARPQSVVERDFAQAVPAALSRGSRLASLARGSGGSSGKPLAHSGVSLPEGDSGHRSALRSPLPWRERVRVRGTPEVTPGVPVRSPRARGSDAAAHRRSRISGPCTRATPATVFADHRMPSLAAPPRGAPHPHPNGVGPVTRMLLRDWSRTRRPVSTALPRGLRTSRERPCPGWYVRVVRSTAGVSCPRALFH